MAPSSCVGVGSATSLDAADTANPHNPMLHAYGGEPPPRFRYEVIQMKSATLNPLKARCGGRPTRPPAPSGAPGASCEWDAARLSAHGVRLLIGVFVTPANRLQRDVIRESWMRWESVGRSTLVCFVIGRLGMPPSRLAALDAEAAAKSDILWLPNTADGCYLTLSKVHDFWRAAAAKLRPPGEGGVMHVAKVDEDSFINVPNLVEDLRQLGELGCADHLYYGPGAWAGYHPTKYNMCGFSWRGADKYNRYGCAAGGAHPAFPFVMGGLQLLSASVVSHIATSTHIAEFVARSDAQVDYAKLRADPRLTVNDDVVVGFWLSDAQLRGRLPNVTNVFINGRAKNVECDMRDCTVRKICGLYTLPTNSSVLIHNLKSALMLPFVWAVVRGRAKHDPGACKAFFKHRPGLTSVEPVQRWLVDPDGGPRAWFARRGRGRALRG